MYNENSSAKKKLLLGTGPNADQRIQIRVIKIKHHSKRPSEMELSQSGMGLPWWATVAGACPGKCREWGVCGNPPDIRSQTSPRQISGQLQPWKKIYSWKQSAYLYGTTNASILKLPCNGRPCLSPWGKFAPKFSNLVIIFPIISPFPGPGFIWTTGDYTQSKISTVSEQE